MQILVRLFLSAFDAQHQPLPQPIILTWSDQAQAFVEDSLPPYLRADILRLSDDDHVEIEANILPSVSHDIEDLLTYYYSEIPAEEIVPGVFLRVKLLDVLTHPE